ncbi:MAG: mercuric transport protein periplasmic component [Betaproteobacteria bacterium RIFCSPLOWO2_02_67_12]|nr:MAG: mercuric transport protein periplasmic component [Betaproteobacteria bacterium RIFCSPLOWO2_02_67_12]OGA64335.1 MAG: mercuric transport protein periplasmic component [Betaproteobacteria bacterium RIFCSPLOWO2_12_FULL_67_28]
MRPTFWVSLAAFAFAASALAAEPARVVLDVPSMNCPLCPVSVKKALERVPGVLEAKADLATKSAEAKYDPDKVSPETLAKAVTNAGYPASLKSP